MAMRCGPVTQRRLSSRGKRLRLMGDSCAARLRPRLQSLASLAFQLVSLLCFRANGIIIQHSPRAKRSIISKFRPTTAAAVNSTAARPSQFSLSRSHLPVKSISAHTHTEIVLRAQKDGLSAMEQTPAGRARHILQCKMSLFGP